MLKVDLDKLSTNEVAQFGIAVLEHMRTVSCVDFVKAARLGFYFSQRVLTALKNDFRLDEAEVQKTFALLSQGMEGSMITDVNLNIAKAPTDKEAYGMAEELVGHYSTNEMLEIRHPRLRNDNGTLLSYVDGIRSSGNYAQNFEEQKRKREEKEEELLISVDELTATNFLEVLRASQTYMSLRETVKYFFVKEYGLLRDSLELLGKRLNLEDGDIYFLYPREIARLLDEPQELKHIITSRKRAFANYKDLSLPNVVREVDIDNLTLNEDDLVEFQEARGKFLADGEAFSGVVVNLDEFDNLKDVDGIIKEIEESGRDVVLVATQMNLGHDPYIARSRGLIIENAGIVSHGAQRARELGRGELEGIKS